jgi:uncharacterized membrane protein (DUF2068 family)
MKRLFAPWVGYHPTRDLTPPAFTTPILTPPKAAARTAGAPDQREGQPMASACTAGAGRCHTLPMASNSKMLRLIALFKFFKVATLILVGVASLKLMHSDLADTLAGWADKLHLASGHLLVDQAIEKAANIPPGKMKIVSLGSFLYAALFLTEGIGLWLQKRWAEWFTVIITSSLVPLEIYELIHHPTWIKAVVLLINIAVVAYLLYRIRHEPMSEPRTT